MKRIVQFFREVRRRHVFRVALVYVLVGWALLQVGEIVFPALSLPSWALTLLLALVVFGFPIALVLAWAFDLTPDGVVRTDSDEAPVAEGPNEPQSPDADGPPGIIVLAFRNMSPEAENEYFSDGIAEDLLTRLCQSRLSRDGALRVISRTTAWRYKEAPASAREIAAELGITYLVEGSVRRSDRRVRISAQLVDARGDRQLWSETYDRDLEDIFGIQEEVARSIADALDRTLVRAGDAPAVDDRRTSDVEAYDVYLRGRFHWNRRTPADLDTAASLFEEATSRDPEFAQARAALAETFVTQAVYGLQPASDLLPSARLEAQRALRTAPDLAPARVALASVQAIYDWDWNAAARTFETTIAENDQYPTALQWYAMHTLAPLGRIDEAWIRLEQAKLVDPMAYAIAASFGVLKFLDGEYAEALDRFIGLIEREPGIAFGQYYAGLSLLQMGRPADAVTRLERARELGSGSAEILAALGQALARSDRESEARDLLRRMENAERYMSPTRLGQLLISLGEYDTALERLDAAVAERAADVIWLDVFPTFDLIRDRPRFVALRDQVFGSCGQGG